MGDRYDRRPFHINSEALLRRPGLARPTLGHNGGPALDLSGEMWLWKRAVAKAWKTPPREIALMRLRRAEQLGLSYRAYTAVLLDRGRSLSTAIFSLSALAPTGNRAAVPSDTVALDPAVEAAFARLANCDVLVLGDARVHRRWLDGRDGAQAQAALNRALGGKIAALHVGESVAVPGADDARLAPLRDFLRRQCRAPSEAFMVGTTLDDAALAHRAGLSLFVWAEDYFKPAG